MPSGGVTLSACRISWSSHDAASKEVLLRSLWIELLPVQTQLLFGLEKAMRSENGVYGMVASTHAVVVPSSDTHPL
jgi:hypothetical protein